MPERIYFADSFLCSFEAHVRDARQQGELWQLALDRTAFYPAGGGQPCDLGVLVAAAADGAVLDAPVLAVEQEDGGEIWHTTAKALPAGAEIRGEIDFSRRLDHMQQHSGQHLLSAIFQDRMNAKTISFHLGEHESTIDLDRSSATAEELVRVEDAANLAIAEDHAVTTRFVSHSEAEALLAAGKLRKLPPREGNIRLVEIEQLDLNACGGTHVRSTGQIGGLLIRGTERVRQNLRVAFVCGLRAVRTSRSDLAALNQAASLLSVSRAHLDGAIERLAAAQSAAAKDRRILRERLAESEAANLVAATGPQNGLRVVRRQFPDMDAEYVKMLASKIATASGTGALVATTAVEPAKFVFAASHDLDANCGALVKDKLKELGGRGGGAAAMAQGEVSGSRVDELFSALESNLREAVRATAE